MQRFLGALLLFMAVIGSGCASAKTRLDASLINQVHEGQSTRQQVEQLLGRPRNMTTGGTGRTVAMYSFASAQSAGFSTAQVQSRVYSVRYDPQFVVEKTHLSSGMLKITEGFSRKVGTPLSREEVIAAAQPGATREEVIRRLGTPTVESLLPEGGIGLHWMAQNINPWVGRYGNQVVVVRCDDAGLVVDYVVEGNLDTPPAGVTKSSRK